MTAPSSIDPTLFLHEQQLGSASPDLLRSMLTTFMRVQLAVPILPRLPIPLPSSPPAAPWAWSIRRRAPSAGTARCAGREDGSRADWRIHAETQW
jgi:hypothetical protein